MDWQPIETLSPLRDVVLVAFFRPVGGGALLTFGPVVGYKAQLEGMAPAWVHWPANQPAPTHWLALPKAPKDA